MTNLVSTWPTWPPYPTLDKLHQPVNKTISTLTHAYRTMLALRQRDMLGTSTDWLALQNDLEIYRKMLLSAFLHIENSYPILNHQIGKLHKDTFPEVLSQT